MHYNMNLYKFQTEYSCHNSNLTATTGQGDPLRLLPVCETKALRSSPIMCATTLDARSRFARSGHDNAGVDQCKDADWSGAKSFGGLGG